MAPLLEPPGLVFQHRTARPQARSETSDIPSHHRRRPGVFPAPAVLSSDSSSLADTGQKVYPGRGRLELMIPEDRLACWQVGFLALHQSLLDLRLHTSGLVQPPRTATSIPAWHHSARMSTGPYPLLSPGLSSTLAAGRAIFDLGQSRIREPCLQRSQGWVDCYQDPQNCAICHQLAPQVALLSLTQFGQWLWQTGCLDRPLMMLGFESAQAAVYISDSSQCTYR